MRPQGTDAWRPKHGAACRANAPAMEQLSAIRTDSSGTPMTTSPSTMLAEASRHLRWVRQQTALPGAGS